MERGLDDCEFWLPPQFLTDNDLLMDFRQSGNEGNKCPGFAAFGFNSGLSSPVESLVCSTETESDEDDYISGLSRIMAQSTLGDNSYRLEANKVWGLSGSPKSPLCSGIVGYGSSQCTQRSSSQMSSAPGLKRHDGARGLLCAAAAEVSRMKMVEEAAGFYPTRKGPSLHSTKPGPMNVPLETSELNQRRLSYQHLQVLRELEQQMMKQNHQQRNGVCGQAKVGCCPLYQPPNLNRPTAQSKVRHVADERLIKSSMSAWPTLQQYKQQPQPQHQPGSGMRAVFLGAPGAKTKSAGTGVFLPRTNGSPTETRRNNKPACSTVLLPDRVVQALNLNLDAMDTQPQLNSRRITNLAPHYDGALLYNKNMVMVQQGRATSVRTPPQPTAMNHPEVRLPQEWTY